jgi:hypothetical protein
MPPTVQGGHSAYPRNLATHLSVAARESALHCLEQLSFRLDTGQSARSHELTNHPHCFAKKSRFLKSRRHVCISFLETTRSSNYNRKDFKAFRLLGALTRASKGCRKRINKRVDAICYGLFNVLGRKILYRSNTNSLPN